MALNPDSTPPPGSPLVIDDWPMSLDTTRAELHKAKKRLERYQSFLRLANIEIEQRNRYIIALTTFVYQASNVGSSATALKLALVQALETTNTTIGAIVLVSENKTLALKVHKGLSPQLINIVTGQDFSQSATALMPCLVTGDGALLEYKTADDERERQLLTASGLTSLVSFPLQVGEQVMGAVLVGLQGDRIFKPSELCFLMALSQETAVVLDALRLREGLWQTAEILLEQAGEPEELSETFPEELGLDIKMPLALPLVAPTVPQPTENDLEQLLAAMMEAEDEVQQQNSDLQTLNVIAASLHQTLELKEVLQAAVEQTHKTLNCDAAWLYLLDSTKLLRMQASVGLSDVYRRGMQSLKVGEAAEGQVLAQNSPLFIDHLTEGSQEHKLWVEQEGLLAIAVVPLVKLFNDSPHDFSHPVTGVLAIGYKTTAAAAAHIWSPREMRLLTSIGSQVSLAIHNARLYSRLRDKEISARTGNEVLQTINSILLNRTINLEGFINSEITDRVRTARYIVNQLLRTATSSEQQRRLGAIKDLLRELHYLAVKANTQSEILPVAPDPDAELKPELTDMPVVPPLFATAPKSPAKAAAPPPSKPKSPSAPPPNHPLSFAEAVAAGLVPSFILEREKNNPE